MLKHKSTDAKSAGPDGKAEVGAGAPDPSKCRAVRRSHGLDLALCLVRPTPSCQFGLPFAGTYSCRHPEVERIIARTLAQL